MAKTTQETQYAIFETKGDAILRRVHTVRNATLEEVKKLAQDKKWLQEHNGVFDYRIMKRTVTVIEDEWEEA